MRIPFRAHERSPGDDVTAPLLTSPSTMSHNPQI